MNSNNYEFLLLKDELGVKNDKDLIEYEKKLFIAFSNEEWVMKNYKIIDNCRLIPSLPYKDVFIAVVKQNKEIIVGVSGHYNTNNEFQLEKMGFKLSIKNESCEGLSFFTTKNIGEKFIYLFDYLFKHLVEILSKKNIKIFYLTTSEKSLKMYNLFGFEISDEIVINNKKKYLLKINID